MRVCPNCGYRDPDCWKPPYSRGMEVDHGTIENVELEYPLGEPEIAKHLKDAIPNKRGLREWQDELYAYGLWPSGYVRRRLLDIWKVQGWKAIPMEKHESHPRLPKLDVYCSAKLEKEK